ncbi:MAG: O-antigen ligase family protein [Bacteroidota bacterium]
MSNLVGLLRTSDDPREEFLALLTAGILSLLFVFLVTVSGGNTSVAMLFPAGAFVALMVTNVELALAGVIISLFLNVHVLGFASGVWFSLPFGLAFILKHTNLQWKELRNPLTSSLVIYGLCIIPSFINAALPLTSFLKLFNVMAFMIMLFGLIATIKTHRELQRALLVYLALAFANSVHVIFQSLTGARRAFGFAGIMFVDYSALAVCLTAAIVVTMKKGRRISFVAGSVIFVALILTQTRNTWLSAIITLVWLVGYLVRHPEVAGLSRKRVVAIASLGLLVLASISVALLSLNTRLQKRASEFTENPSYGIDESGRVESSLGTRLFIWDTALNAFRAHPIVGIGVYAFPYSSEQYSTTTKRFYNDFVRRNSPHQTHLAVLAETGLLGALGFSMFAVAALKYSFRVITGAASERDRRYAFVGATGVVYCFVSMMFTDAWLWGQGIVLLGVILGLVMALRKFSAAPIAEPHRL